MKKLLCIVMACAFILGGCANQADKVVCKYSKDKVNSENTLEYKDDKIVKQTTLTKLNTKKTDVDKDQIKSLMKDTKKIYKIDGVTFDYEINKDYVETTLTIDFEKAKVIDLVEAGLINEYDESGKKVKRVRLKMIQEGLEQIGYKCK